MKLDPLKSVPLITIGIPTLNRAHGLARSIDSARGRDYPRLEVIVSDNASEDGTAEICVSYRGRDPRFQCVRLTENQGATANFMHVLELASCDYFMWLGDDDWLDPSYVSRCIEELMANPPLVLASGLAWYYRQGKSQAAGAPLEIVAVSWARRMLNYDWKVSETGMFYGVMRTAHLRKAGLRKSLGGDWHTIAAVLAGGGATTRVDVYVHHELGGASASPAQIAKTPTLPRT